MYSEPVTGLPVCVATMLSSVATARRIPARYRASRPSPDVHAAVASEPASSTTSTLRSQPPSGASAPHRKAESTSTST